MEPLDTIRDGYFGKKPLIIGTTTEETRPFIYEGFRKPVSPLKYSALLSLLNPPSAADILTLYPPTAESDERYHMQVPATDFVFTCCTRNYSRNAASRNGDNVWYYVFDHSWSFPDAWANLTFCRGHVCHGAELPFVFQTASLYNYSMTTDEVSLSDLMIKYWTNFAKSHDPNVGENVDLKWPTYSEEHKWAYLHFSALSNVYFGDYRQSFCDFWDRIGYSFPKWIYKETHFTFEICAIKLIENSFLKILLSLLMNLLSIWQVIIVASQYVDNINHTHLSKYISCCITVYIRDINYAY